MWGHVIDQHDVVAGAAFFVVVHVHVDVDVVDADAMPVVHTIVAPCGLFDVLSYVVMLMFSFIFCVRLDWY